MALPYLYDVEPLTPGVTLWHAGKIDSFGYSASRKLGLLRQWKSWSAGDAWSVYDLAGRCENCTEIIQPYTSSSRMGGGDWWVRVYCIDVPKFEDEFRAALADLLKTTSAEQEKRFRESYGPDRAEIWGLEVTTYRR